MKIERGQKAIKNQHTVPDHVLAYPLRQNFPAQKNNWIFTCSVTICSVLFLPEELNFKSRMKASSEPHSKAPYCGEFLFFKDSSAFNRVHAKGVVLSERACLCLLSAFYNSPPSKNLSAPKSRDSLRLRRRFLPLPTTSRDFLRPQDARFPLRRRSLANRDFFCEENG